MYIPKRYGESKVARCPFCEQQAITKNKQDIPVCLDHKQSVLNEMKCSCGDYLELKIGKYGPYFNCLHCGNMNMKKVFEINKIEDVSGNKPVRKQPKEIVIRSDDPLYF